MTKSVSVQADWRPNSVSFALTAALAAFMLFLGARGLAAPLAAAKGFGLPLHDAGDAVWLQIKAGRDLCAGLSLVAFLALRNTRAMAIFLLANASIPMNDLLVSLSAPIHRTGYALSVHGGAATLMCCLAASLLAGAGRSPAHQAADGNDRDRAPAPAAGR